MTRQILATRGNLIESYVENDNTLQIKVFSVDLTTRKLEETCVFAWTTKVKVDLLHLDEVQEESTCNRIPVALISLNERNTKGEVTCYLLYVNINAKKCVPLRRWLVKRKYLEKVLTSNTPDSNLILLDGPSVLLLSDESLSISTCTEGVTLNEYITSPIQNCTECLTNLLSSQVFHCKSQFRWKVTCLGVTLSKTCTSCCRQNGQSLIVSEFREGNYTLHDPCKFIPEEFHEGLNSIYIQDINFTKDSVILSRIYASTKNGFLLSLHDGHLMKCISLCHDITRSVLPGSVEDISIQCLQYGSKQFVIAKRTGECFILDQELKKQKEVTGIQHIFYTDFIGTGTRQCLFVKSQTLVLSDWILDDFNQLYIKSTDQDTSQDKVDDSTRTATRALQSRLQKEQLFLQQQKQTLHKKENLIQQTVLKQLHSAAGYVQTESQSRVDLVTLIEGQAEQVKDTGKCDEKPSQSTVEVQSLWQKTFNNKWCLGVEFYWKSKCPGQAWLNVIPNKDSGSLLTCQSMSVICKTQPLPKQHRKSNQCQQKYQKLDGPAISEWITDDSFLPESMLDPVLYTATCVTDIPQFYQSSVSVCLVLKWRYLQIPSTLASKESEGDTIIDISDNDLVVDNAIGDVTERTVFTVNCGDLTINSEEVLIGKYEIPFRNDSDLSSPFMEEFTDMKRNKLAWTQMQTCTRLIIKSSIGVLTQLEKFLTERCSFVYNQQFQCYITPITSLAKVQLQLPPSMLDTSRKMTAYTSCERDLFLLLHHLYRCLPDNLVILPDKQIGKQSQKILPRIQQETSFFSQGIRKLLDDHDRKFSATGGGKEEETDKKDDLKEIGERFKRKREEFLQSEEKNVDVSSLEDFLSELALFQKKTDSIIASS